MFDHAGIEVQNVYWFINTPLCCAALAGVNYSGILDIKFDFWDYFLIIIAIFNVFLKAQYVDFGYQSSVRSCFLGTVLTLGVYIAWTAEAPWNIVGWYVCVLAFFHFSEFITIAICNPSSLSISSFILNHSVSYLVALAASWIEFILEAFFYPEIKSPTWLSWIGFALCLSGEILRKSAMITASTNFNHLVQIEKESTHQLVTTGVYSWFRHPSYVGWFTWSIATQLLLLNPFCAIVYAVVSWLFFNDRIMMEEVYLLDFFGEEYVEYQQRVGTGIPFIRGVILDSPKKDS